MSFEEEFFGSGNRLRWSAIQSGVLSNDVKERLGPFIDDMRRNPDVLVLPRVTESDNRVEWYVLCSSPRFARAARDEVRAFVGSTYSDLEESRGSLNASDSVDAAVLSRYGTAAFKLHIPDQTLVNEARLRLRLMMDLRTERPVRFARQVRATGRALRDFEYALIARDAAAARGCMDELRSTGRLGATNALFMEVRVLAALEQWSAIFAMPEFESLLGMSRPRRATESLLRALYSMRLKQLEIQQDAAQALRVFREELLPRYRDLLRTKSGLAGYEIDLAFLLASLTADPPDRRRAEAVITDYDGDPRVGFLRALVSSAPAAEQASENPFQTALNAFASGQVDRAFELALPLPPSFERLVLLFRCAREIASLSAATEAISAFNEASVDDRQRIEKAAGLARIYSHLSELQPQVEPSAVPPPKPPSPPTSWLDWLSRLSESTRWRSAVNVAEIGSREWDFEAVASDASAVIALADALLVERPGWGRSALRDSMPFLVDTLLLRGPDARLKPLLESLFLSIALDDQMSLPQFAVLIRIAEASVELGVAPSEYAEVITQLQRGLDLIASPSASSAALETLDMLVGAPCPNEVARQGFVAYTIGFFTRWYRRIDTSQWSLLLRLGEELGVPIEVPDVARLEQEAVSVWDALNDKRVALYSLRESVIRRVELVLRELCPSIHVQTFADRVGGSPALRTAAATADVFVVATAAAKHAATIFIDANRPKDRATLYARGQGSASLLEALRAHLE